MSVRDPKAQVRVITVTVSDTRDPSTDEVGPLLQSEFKDAGFKIVRHVILIDEPDYIRELVRAASTDNEADAIVMAGGTGLAPRDRTTEALESVFEKKLPGFGEAFRRLSWDEIGPKAILSRATAGTVQGCLVYSLPGSVNGARLGVKSLIIPTLQHAVDLASGRHTLHSSRATKSG